MQKSWKLILTPVMCVTLTACGLGGGGGKKPTGQVVATVDGEEITSLELRNELDGMTFPDAKARKVAEQRALQMIITRKVLAKAAKEQKLDKTPEFALRLQRGEENLLAQTLQQTITKNVPDPTREEAESYVAANRNLFAERKIFGVDQIRIARPTDPKLMAEFEPLKTFEEVEAMLKSKNIQYQRGVDQIDARGTNPKLIDAIANLPPGEVFVLPMGQLVLINRVRETRTVPFVGDPAVKFALDMLKNQRRQDTVNRQLGGLVAAAQPKISYNKAYEPVKPPPAKAAAPALKGAVAPVSPAAAPSAAAAPANTAPATPGT